MLLSTTGCNFRHSPVEVREKLAFTEARQAAALDELAGRYGCEAVVLSTCNRVEIFLARAEGENMPGIDLVSEFLGASHGLPADWAKPHLYQFTGTDAIRHLCRVAASLDSMIVGEGQIASQVKRAYEAAHVRGTVGPALHSVFQHAQRVAKRVRTETGIARGNVSVSSVAVAYVQEVFDHFGDKTILVIGAGKMGELTLKHLKRLLPRQILVANRSAEKAEALARQCAGTAVAWDQLDQALTGADVVLSTTGAPEPIVDRARFDKLLGQRSSGRPMVILDIAVPRDFDPRIHDGDRAFLFNIDDLQRIRDRTLSDRGKHLGAAETIVEQECTRFFAEWQRKKNGPLIAKLTEDFEAKRLAIVAQLMARLNGKLSEGDREQIDGAFRLLQNKFLHSPISALAEEPQGDRRHTLRDALRKLFRLDE
jgi:glutamyl-tRNA reductase